MSASQVFGLPSVFFGPSFGILLSERQECILTDVDKTSLIGKNVKQLKDYKPLNKLYGWLVLHSGLDSLTSWQFSIHHALAQILPPHILRFEPGAGIRAVKELINADYVTKLTMSFDILRIK